MLLSRNEIQARATHFAKKWKDAHYEKGETQTFYNEFFDVFGKKRLEVARYEQAVKKLDNKQGFIDLFWAGQLLIEQKSAGRDLNKAREQAFQYRDALKDHEKPRYLLLSDFQNFELLDLEKDSEYRFPLAELPKNVRLFDFISGYKTVEYRDQDPVNIQASELMSVLHQQLESSNYRGADLERLLVRIMFCLFADDTGIFELNSFTEFIENHTKNDGSDLGNQLVFLFQILDTPEDDRQTNLDQDLQQFPYVNGRLFSDAIKIPHFTAPMRQALLDCCYFDWAKVSPALFGSLFQTVMLPDEQRQGGAHYTSERNILKTIHPLFLDDLYEELNKIKALKRGKPDALQKFHQKLGQLTFFDPACGCGNFLILAYREIRELEIKVLEELHPGDRTGVLNVADLSVVDVDQFFGIEIEEFAVRIAETALYLVDHQMNVKLSASFGQAIIRLPLKKSAKIVHANALSTDWKTVLPPENCSFMLGNPPFVGKSLRSKTQTEELEQVFLGVKGAKELDYVCCWFYKAGQYIQDSNVKVAFVSTNSIAQGEQVGILWAELMNRYGIKIHFAHQTFKWTIDEKKAKGMKIAAVFVVIVGFSKVEPEKRTLYRYETVSADPVPVAARNINPYLIDGENVLISVRNSPICNVPAMVYGSKPVDGGHFLFTPEEKEKYLLQEPKAEKYFRPMVSAHEFLNGLSRWCLWLKDANPSEIREMPLVLERIKAVKEFRLASTKAQTRQDADRAQEFTEIRQSESNAIAIPRHSSENRDYIPFGFFDSQYIIHDSCSCIPNAALYHFGVITSTMHMVWMRYVCGRLEGRYRYSNTIVYNNYPWPQPTDAQRKSIETHAQAVLDARAQFPDSSLADLYDPLTMPPPLRKAHTALDRAVEKAYRKDPFRDDAERVEYLFLLYRQLTAGLLKDLEVKTKKGRKGGKA